MKIFSYICLGVLGLMLSANAVAQTVLTDFEPPKDSINTPDFDMRAAAILPFFTHLVVDTAGPPPLRELRMREIAMEHVNGMRWASHRLNEAGYNVELSFLDECPDTLGVSLWDHTDVKGMDLVLGPLQQSELSRSMRAIEAGGADHIILTKVNPHLLNNGDHVRSILPSQEHFLDLLIDQIISEHISDNVIFVMAGGADTALEQKFLELYPATPAPYDSLLVDSMRFDTVLGSRHSIGSLPEKLQFYERNVIVSVASKRSRSMLSNMQMAVQVNDSTEIFVYSNTDLMNLGFIDMQFLSRTKTTLPVSGKVSYSDSTIHDAINTYRNMYDSDPSDYAVKAHDAMLDAFSRKLAQMPLDSAITDTTAVWDLSSLPQPVATDFVWSQVSEGAGYVNATWELSTFHQGKWCETDTVPSLPQFILPELDEDGNYIKP